MPKTSSARKGSLQYWPRKRAKKILPSLNWGALSKENGILGLIAYKAGMKSALVKDLTEHSLTKNKPITMPVTILECPGMKILSVRLYKHGLVSSEFLNSNLEKELKRKIKIRKEKKNFDSWIKDQDYDDIRVIVYSLVKKTKIKKTPDIAEMALAGTKEEKIEFVSKNLEKEINVQDILSGLDLVDIRGVTRGKGLQGPVKRFGITLKSHKSEKGRRRPGSLGPWHPARVTFRAPMAGQTGLFTRAMYNLKVLGIKNKTLEMGRYGSTNTDYIILRGSVQGPLKRQLIVTVPLRETKKQKKKKFELIELR